MGFPRFGLFASKDDEEEVEVIDFFGLGGRLLLFVLFEMLVLPFLAAAAAFLAIRGLLEEFCLFGLLFATTGDTASDLLWLPPDTDVNDGGEFRKSDDLFCAVVSVLFLESSVGVRSLAVLDGDDGGEEFSFLGESSFQLVTSPAEVHKIKDVNSN